MIRRCKIIGAALTISMLIMENGYSQDNNQFIVQPAHTNFEQLKELNWFVGDWVDQDDNVVNTSSFQWDMNKNFLTQHFNLKVLGQEYLSGLQIIGWDPIKKKFARGYSTPKVVLGKVVGQRKARAGMPIQSLSFMMDARVHPSISIRKSMIILICFHLKLVT